MTDCPDWLSTQAPTVTEYAFNLCLLLWKLDARREACGRWLSFRGYPADATAAAYCGLAERVSPAAGSEARPHSHASGSVGSHQVAALDRLALRYFEEMRRVEEFPEYWEAAGRV